MDTPSARDMVELPGPFSFKIFVKPELIDGQGLRALSSQQLGRDLGDHQLTERVSGKGTYICYTLRLHIENYDEIEGLYRVFKDHRAVVFLL